MMFTEVSLLSHRTLRYTLCSKHSFAMTVWSYVSVIVVGPCSFVSLFYKHQKLYLDEIWQNDGSELTWKTVWVIYNTVHLRSVKKESVWITYIPDEIRKGTFRVPIFIFAILLMLQKTRYSAEEELPPPPSPPQLKEVSALDGVPRPASTERILAETAAQHVILRDDLQQVGTALFLQRSFKLSVVYVRDCQPATCNFLWYCVAIVMMVWENLPCYHRQCLAVPFAVVNGLA